MADEPNQSSLYIPRRQEFLDDILRHLEDPIHKRLLQAYRSDNPVNFMETELGRILKEILEK